MTDTGVEQRLAAILAADVAGYTRLMADDEAATLAALDAARSVFRDNVNAEGGRVVDTAGDSVLAVFATATGAVRAALAIQQALRDAEANVPEDRRMRFRIGVNLGEVMEKADGSIYGAGVNVAARLESLAEPGSVMVSEDVQRQAKDRLDAVFYDVGAHTVKNVADRVRAFRVGQAGSAPARGSKSKRALVAAVSMLVLIAAGAVWWFAREAPPAVMLTAAGEPTDDPVLAVPTGPSIAVLPFVNVSGDPEQDYFADGISEDILNQISPAMGIQVISRSSSFRYRGADIDASQAGAELGAQFLVVGSVRRAEGQIRVTAELVEVASGKKVWSDTYDRDLNIAELFAVQDDISQSIVATITDEYGVISQITRQKARDGEASLGSYECVLRAYHYFEYFNEANHLLARDCLEEAVQRDPLYAEAWGWLAILYANEHAWNFNLRDDPLGRSLGAGNTAVSADRNSQMAWEGKAAAHYFRDEWDEFHPAAQRAISINPNDISTLGNIAWYYGNFGRYDYALPLMDKAISLSPFPPGFYFFPYWQKFYSDGDYERALDYAVKGEYVGFWVSQMMFASTYAELGDDVQAANYIEELREAKPDIVETYRGWANALHWPVELIDKVEAGLEKAGLEIRTGPPPLTE